jgi:hypothetical protein
MSPNIPSGNRALTHLDVSGNSLGHLVPPEGWEAHGNGTHYRRHGGIPEDWSTTVPAGSQPLGIIAIANAIPDMGAMMSLHVGMNSIPEKEMKEIITIAMRKDSMKILCEVPIKDKTLTMLDISGKNLGMEGAVVVAEYLRDNGAISSVNLLKNDIPMEQVKALAFILKDHPTLKSLCGNSGEETELDMSGKQIGAEGAVMLAPEIAGNGALTSLDLSSNNLGAQGGKIFAEAIKVLIMQLRWFWYLFMSI